MAALSRNMQGRQPGSVSPSRSWQVGNEAGLACPVALPTTEGFGLLNYASVMLSSLWDELSKQEHRKPQESEPHIGL